MLDDLLGKAFRRSRIAMDIGLKVEQAETDATAFTDAWNGC